MTEVFLLSVMFALPAVIGGLLYALIRIHLNCSGKRYAWFRVLLGNLLVFAFLLSTCTLAGELYYRYWYDASDSNALTKTHQRWLERHYNTTINSQGVRDNVDYPSVVPSGKRRVTFLGDSFTFGHGIANIDDRFANIIRRRRPDWDITLAGAMGYNTPQEVALLFRSLGRSPSRSTLVLDPSGRIELGKDSAGRTILGKDSRGRIVLRDSSNAIIAEPDMERIYAGTYQFDVVVLVFNLNDIHNFVPGIESWAKIVYEDSAPGWLGRNSFLFNTLHYRLLVAYHPEVAQFSVDAAGAYDPSGTAWAALQTELNVLRALVATGGGRLLVVTFPYLDYLGKDYPFRKSHACLDAYWRKAGVPHLDLLNAFEAKLPATFVVNRYDAHPNESAHAVAADAILPFIEQHLGPPPS